MTRNSLKIALIVGIVAVVAGYFWVTRQSPNPAAGQPEFALSGNYSDDWQTHCGPLAAAAQTECTSRLDSRYGRAAGLPLPPLGSGR